MTLEGHYFTAHVYWRLKTSININVGQFRESKQAVHCLCVSSEWSLPDAPSFGNANWTEKKMHKVELMERIIFNFK